MHKTECLKWYWVTSKSVELLSKIIYIIIHGTKSACEYINHGSRGEDGAKGCPTPMTQFLFGLKNTIWAGGDFSDLDIQ